MRIEGTKKAYIEVDDSQLDDIVAEHIKNTYYEALDTLTEEEQFPFKFIFRFFTGKNIDDLDRW